MYSDFEIYGGSLGLNCCCLYGGSPYQPQQIQLKRGVDIVVGTPGRIKVGFLIGVDSKVEKGLSHYFILHAIASTRACGYIWSL